MSKHSDGLCRLLITVMGRQSTSGELYCLNRNRPHIKLLSGEHGGFVFYDERLGSWDFSVVEQLASPLSSHAKLHTGANFLPTVGLSLLRYALFTESK